MNSSRIDICRIFNVIENQQQMFCCQIESSSQDYVFEFEYSPITRHRMTSLFIMRQHREKILFSFHFWDFNFWPLFFIFESQYNIVTKIYETSAVKIPLQRIIMTFQGEHSDYNKNFYSFHFHLQPPPTHSPSTRRASEPRASERANN